MATADRSATAPGSVSRSALVCSASSSSLSPSSPASAPPFAAPLPRSTARRATCSAVRVDWLAWRACYRTASLGLLNLLLVAVIAVECEKDLKGGWLVNNSNEEALLITAERAT